MPALDSDSVMKLAHSAASMLYERGARRVWLFGSLAVGRSLDDFSDLDLVVEGLPAYEFSRTQRDLMRLAGRKVDLVEMESAAPRLRPHILRTRVLVTVPVS